MLRKRHLQRGMSIIEAMIIVVIIAIAMAVGVPNMVEWMQNAQIRTAAESMLNGLQTARAEAIRRNATVQFSMLTPGSAGETGWQITLVNTGATVQSKPKGEGSQNVTVTATPSDSSGITFDGFGRAPTTGLNNDGTPTLTQLDFTSVATGGTWRNLRIRTTAGGDIRLCDPNVSSSSDPRSC